jgi:hypothetical protein
MSLSTGATSATSLERRPYLGLKSFKEEDQNSFFGRDKETGELLSLMEDHILTVLCGKSGIGKTSLVKAGLVPALKKEYYLPIYIRVNFEDEICAPIVQVKQAVQEQVSLVEKAYDFEGEATLWEYFHGLGIVNGFITPIIIFDQFEEIFTLGKRTDQKEELLQQLSDLIENRIPASVSEKYRSQKKFVPTVLLESKKYRVIFSMREDYLPQLDALKNIIPSVKWNQYRIQELLGMQAREAIMQPALDLIELQEAVAVITKIPSSHIQEYAPAHYQPKTGESWECKKIEPFLLSLYCYQLNELRILHQTDKITMDLIEQVDVENLVKKHYENTLNLFGEEEEAQKVNRAIEDLLTNDGHRKLHPVEELMRTHALSEKEIEMLVDQKIIRREKRGAILYVELIHDILIGVVKERRDKRVYEEQLIEERKKQEAFIEKQRIETNQMRQRAKYIRRIARISAAAAVVSLLLLTYAILQARKAKKQELLALQSKTQAEAQSTLAKRNASLADQERKKANVNAAMAKANELEAFKQKKLADEQAILLLESERKANTLKLRAEKQQILALEAKAYVKEANYQAKQSMILAQVARDSLVLMKTKKEKDSLYRSSKKLEDSIQYVIPIQIALEKSSALRENDPVISYYYARQAYQIDNRNQQARRELVKAFNVNPFYTSSYIKLDSNTVLKRMTDNGKYLIEIASNGKITISGLSNARTQYTFTASGLSNQTSAQWELKTLGDHLLLIHDPVNAMVNLWSINDLPTPAKLLWEEKQVQQIKFATSGSHLICLKNKRIELLPLNDFLNNRIENSSNFRLVVENLLDNPSLFSTKVDYLEMPDNSTGSTHWMIQGNKLYNVDINSLEKRSGIVAKLKHQQDVYEESEPSYSNFICFTPDQKHVLISWSYRNANYLTFRSILKNRQVDSYKYDEPMGNPVLSPQGLLAFPKRSNVSLFNGTQEVFTTRSTKSKGFVSREPFTASALDISASGKLMAVQDSPGNINLINALTGSLIRNFSYATIEQLKFSPDNQYLYALTHNQLQVIYIQKLLENKTVSSPEEVIDLVEKKGFFGDLWGLTNSQKAKYGLK